MKQTSLKGLSMAVDGNEPDIIRTLLETDMEQTNSRHKKVTLLFLTIWQVMVVLWG